MSIDVQASRNRLIAGIAILAILLLVAVIFLLSSIRQRTDTPRIGHRSPVAELDYCSPDDRKLCVVSFSQIVDGDMQVNIHTPRVFYPKFILLINRFGVESTYECSKENPLSHNAECFGPPQIPGEVLQFKIVFKEQGTLVAEGKFAIIGVALSTPEISSTLTPEELITETLTLLPVLPNRTPMLTLTPMPTRTAPVTSYPNPSYP
ncbi:MAG TPA: hypothetical protein VFY26_00975 [Anaerolineales bacterium]|nr:hypothetical protein [Anaerolineales bacterium]